MPVPKQRQPTVDPHRGPEYTRHAQEFAARVNSDGGASYHLQSKQFIEPGPPETGYMVGGHGGSGESSITGGLRKYQVAAHFARTAILAGTNPNVYAGGWQTPKGSALDISTRMPNRDEAMKAGEERRQEAIYDVHKAEDIPVDRSKWAPAPDDSLKARRGIVTGPLDHAVLAPRHKF